MAARRRTLNDNWPRLRFGKVLVTGREAGHRFEVPLYLHELDPAWVRVEIYAEGVEGNEPVREEMTPGRQTVGEKTYLYSADVETARPAGDFTPRVMARLPDVPLECPLILWQR